LRAHYLALIIRSRATFKRSGTMQAEMMAGGSALWFDLFVAMVEHLVSSSSVMLLLIQEGFVHVLTWLPGRCF
jgi:hypothetical protein